MSAVVQPIAAQIGANAHAITKSDTTVYSPPLTALFVGTTGDVTVMPAGQETAGSPTPVTFKAVAANGWIDKLQISRVMSTGTSASDIVGIAPF
jgi:hypothetical protein